jgi:hypothetical protein
VLLELALQASVLPLALEQQPLVLLLLLLLAWLLQAW